MRKKILEQAIKLFAGEKVLDRIDKLGDKAMEPFYQEQFYALMGIDLKSVKINGELLTLNDLSRFHYELNDRLSSVIINYNGIIDKYERSCIFAYWEIKDKSSLVDACKSSLDVIKTAKQIENDWSNIGISAINPKIALATGKVLMGNFGSSHRMQYTIEGETVDLIHHLLNINDKYNADILIEQSSTDYIDEDIPLRKVDDIIVRGRNDSLSIYTIEQSNTN